MTNDNENRTSAELKQWIDSTKLKVGAAAVNTVLVEVGTQAMAETLRQIVEDANQVLEATEPNRDHLKNLLQLSRHLEDLSHYVANVESVHLGIYATMEKMERRGQALAEIYHAWDSLDENSFCLEGPGNWKQLLWPGSEPETEEEIPF